jgi:outer membrane protein TolC
MNSLESARLGLLSRVDFSIDAPSYYRSLQPQFNTTTGLLEFYQIGETRVESDLSITQPLIFSNGTITLIGSLFGRDQLSQISGTSRDYYTNVALQLRQPLFTANTQKINFNRAELNLEKTQATNTRTQFDIIYNVTQGFYSLYEATKEVEIAEIDVQQRQDAYNTAVSRYNAGLLPEVDMLRLEVELMSGKNELMSKRTTLAEVQNSFKAGIGLSLDEKIDVIPTLEYKPMKIDSLKAVNKALENSVDIKNSRIEVTLQQFSVDETESQRSFRADILANYGLNKNDKDIKNLPKKLSETKSITLTLSLPIWDWGSHARAVEAAEANLKSAELTYINQQVQTRKDIINLLNKIEVSKSRLEVVKRGEEVAIKNYDISLLRFNTGQIKSDELVLEQKRLTNAKLENLSAIIEYKNAMADLKRRTFYDFEIDQPIIIKSDVEK